MSDLYKTITNVDKFRTALDVALRALPDSKKLLQLALWLDLKCPIDSTEDLHRWAKDAAYAAQTIREALKCE